MMHQPNTTHWERGALVLHDADAKRADMLMVVIGFTRAGLVRTRYVHDKHLPTVYANRFAVLHDPTRFGVALPQSDGARVILKLRQIQQVVGTEGGKCINCDMVRTLVRVALTGE